MDKFTNRLEKAEERIRTKIDGGRKYTESDKEKQESGKCERKVFKRGNLWFNIYLIGLPEEENRENGNK